MIATPTPTSEIARMQAGAESSGFRLVGHHDLAGHGDGMQVVKQGDIVYVAHLGSGPMALSVLDCADPTAPRLLCQLPHPPNTHRHKVQVVGDVLVQNSEIPIYWEPKSDEPGVAGLCVLDVSDPAEPRQIGFHPVGSRGVHRFWYSEPPYAHIAAFVPGVDVLAYQIVDLSDPTRPSMAGAWWVPGSHPDDTDAWQGFDDGGLTFVEVHSPIPAGDRAYVACSDAGMAIVDISDVSAPTTVSRISWSPPYGGKVHTCLPLLDRGLVVAVSEVLPAQFERPDSAKLIWLVDIRDEHQPVTIATFPEPTPGPGTPWSSYRERPGRFGPHNVHENRPGSFISDRLIFSTYYNAGLRVYDIDDPLRPEAVAHFVPPTPEGQDAPQLNDLYVDDQRLVYVTDRITGGLYIVEYVGG
jgi:hypothetical protein